MPQAGLLSLPTGGGKTRTAAWFVRTLVGRRSPFRVLWIAPTKELVEQAVSTFINLGREFPTGYDTLASVGKISRSSQRNYPLVVTFLTAQLASRRNDEVAGACFDLLIFDEAHQATARTFKLAIDSVLRNSDSRVLGLTATPGRSDDIEGDDLVGLFSATLIVSNILGPDPVRKLRDLGVLSQVEVRTVPLPKQWEQVRVRSLDSNTLSIDALAANPARFWALVDTMADLGPSTRCLCFGASIAHCYALAAAVKQRGVEVDVISHRISPTRRSLALDRFHSGHTKILFNKSILATGYDCPGITDVVLGTPIRSPILWEQIVGRASRGKAVAGTSSSTIFELDDHRLMHGRVLSYARYLGELWC